MIEFSFHIRKTLAAVGYVCSLNEGKADILNLIKTLYLADRTALLSWKRTITGDMMGSMDNGPVLSITYDLVNRRAQEDRQTIWNEYISERDGNEIRLIRMPDTKYLSPRERELLENVFAKIKDVAPGDLINWLHRAVPEWEDPKGSSQPIDPKDILRSSSMMTEQEINQLQVELDHLKFTDSVLTTE